VHHTRESGAATGASAAYRASADQQPYQAAVFIAPLLLIAFVLIDAALFHAVAEQMGEQKTAETAPAHDSSADQQADEAAVLGGSLALIALVLFVAAPLFHAGPQQMCEEQAPQAAPSGDAGADQEADEAPILAAGTFFAFVLISLVFAGVRPFLHAVAEQVSEHETAQAAPSGDARSDQEAYETALVIAAGFFLSLLVRSFFVAAFFLRSLMEQVREQQPA